MILDQFELPLQQDESDVQEDDFFSSFAEVINAPEVPVHFLIALQSSDFGKLERLEGLIPRIWEHRYELKHLDKKAATQAILEPIGVSTAARVARRSFWRRKRVSSRGFSKTSRRKAMTAAAPVRPGN